MNILLRIFYLLQFIYHRNRNYFEHELNISNFVEGTKHGVHMYAKFGDLAFYGYL
jgi:hypothetical protein